MRLSYIYPEGINGVQATATAFFLTRVLKHDSLGPHLMCLKSNYPKKSKGGKVTWQSNKKGTIYRKQQRY